MKKLFSLVALIGMLLLMSINGFSANHIETDFSIEAEASLEIEEKTDIINYYVISDVTSKSLEAQGIDCMAIAEASFENFSAYFNLNTTIDEMFIIIDMFYGHCLLMQ